MSLPHTTPTNNHSLQKSLLNQEELRDRIVDLEERVRMLENPDESVSGRKTSEIMIVSNYWSGVELKMNSDFKRILKDLKIKLNEHLEKNTAKDDWAIFIAQLIQTKNEELIQSSMGQTFTVAQISKELHQKLRKRVSNVNQFYKVKSEADLLNDSNVIYKADQGVHTIPSALTLQSNATPPQ
jgi:hypothetical protein